MKKIIFYVILIMVSSNICFSVKALEYGGCKYSDISRLKSFVSNINLSVDYYIKNNQAYFNITLSNIIPEVYFVDSITQKKYTYNDTIDGEIIIKDYVNTSGTYKFYSALNECYGIKLNDKYYNLPNYNYYYEDSICQQNRNHTLCQKWIKNNYSYNELKQIIDEYNKKTEVEEEYNDILYEKNWLDRIVGFYIEYYYIILIGVIVICTIVMIINRRKNRFDI